MCVQLGRRYLRCPDKKHVQRVADRLVTELDNLCKEHPREVRQGQVRFWLGRAFFELDDYEQAVTQFQLRATLQFQPLLSRLRLGVAHLRLGHVCSGERILEEVCVECWASDAGSVSVGPPGDQLSRADIVAWARIYLAGSHIDRDVIPEGVATLHEVKAEIDEHRHESSRAGMLAACADWEGWAKFQDGDSDGAIMCLSQSVTLQPRRIGLGAQQLAPLEESLRWLDAERRSGKGEEEPALTSR